MLVLDFKDQISIKYDHVQNGVNIFNAKSQDDCHAKA